MILWPALGLRSIFTHGMYLLFSTGRGRCRTSPIDSLYSLGRLDRQNLGTEQDQNGQLVARLEEFVEASEVLVVRMMDVEVVSMEEFWMDEVYYQCDLMPCFTPATYIFFSTLLIRLSHILFQISVALLCNTLFGLVGYNLQECSHRADALCTVLWGGASLT